MNSPFEKSDYLFCECFMGKEIQQKNKTQFGIVIWLICTFMASVKAADVVHTSSHTPIPSFFWILWGFSIWLWMLKPFNKTLHKSKTPVKIKTCIWMHVCTQWGFRPQASALEATLTPFSLSEWSRYAVPPRSIIPSCVSFQPSLLLSLPLSYTNVPISSPPHLMSLSAHTQTPQSVIHFVFCTSHGPWILWKLSEYLVKKKPSSLP